MQRPYVQFSVKDKKTKQTKQMVQELIVTHPM